jgi:hypothetical protein
MKKQLLLFLLWNFIFGFVYAQDTTVVNILDWDDDQRSGIYTFPDDPNTSYRKIIMKYNMRCHDAAVGNGNVGCREWDYSCNTFITDPTGTDSTRATHPSHLVLGYSGDSYPYTSQEVYYYTQYEQLNTTLTNVSNVNIAQVGDGTTPMFLGVPEGGSKEQYLYQAEELIEAGLTPGPISAVELDVTEQGGTAAFLRIRMQNVDLEELSASAPVVDGFTEVYFKNTTFSDLGWVNLPFYQDFEWDGESDILLELTKNGPSPSPNILFSGNSTTELTGASPVSDNDYYVGFQGGGWASVPADALGFTKEITIAFWSYGLADVLPVNTTVFEARDDDNLRQINVHLPWGNGSIYWDCGNDGTGYDRIFKAADPEEFEGKWNHWAFTKSTITGEMAIYLNGQLWHSETGKTKEIIPGGRMNIGADANGNNRYPGNLDQFSMWNAALSAEEIQQIMFVDKVPSGHPSANDLILHYPMDEGEGLILHDAANSYNATAYGPNWQRYRGPELQLDWLTVSARLNVRFQQSEHTIENESIFVVDTSLLSPTTVIVYDVDSNNDLVIDEVFETNTAGETYLYDEDGNILETYTVQEEGTIDISELEYYLKQDAKYEILSLVTPYGNGLSLGNEGKTFYFDVTDYAPILKGERRFSMEMGGQNQEEFDIDFWFIEGTPARDVEKIQNIWPFRRGWFGEILEDRYFEPRDITLDPQANSYKIRSAITGHGQNGEFIPRDHYIDINGGSDEFVYEVWKECGNIPIYPQGGTWLFDRSGWCPGTPTDVHEFPLDAYLPGETINVDYGLLGSTMSEANYLVSNQLVTYGEPNFTVDASIEAIIRPSNRVEYERYNPICSQPEILIRNNGTETIQSLEISYGLEGGQTLTYDWTGSMAFLEEEVITIPSPDLSFWSSAGEEPVFFAEITAVNGNSGDYQDNNRMTSIVDMPTTFEFDELLQFQFRTNNRASENSYTIRDSEGNIVVSRDNMENATLYKDDIVLPPGCYTLNVQDTGDDGLYYWYWEATNQGVGSGSALFKRIVNDNIQLTVKGFESEFGSSIIFDFILPLTNSNKDILSAQRFSAYPNPTSDLLTVELQGFESAPLNLQLFATTGQLLLTKRLNHQGQVFYTEQLDVSQLPSGLYYLKVQTKDRVWTTDVVKH